MDNNQGAIPGANPENQPQYNDQQNTQPPDGALDNPPAYIPPTGNVPGPNTQQPYQPPVQGQGWQPSYNSGYGTVPAPPPVYPQAAVEQSQPSPASKRRSRIITGLIAAAVILGIAGFAVGGEPGKFMEVGIQFIPFAVLALLAYSGVKSSRAALFAYFCLLVVELLMIFNVIANIFIATVLDFGKLKAWELNPTGVPLSEVFKPNTGSILLWAFLLAGLVWAVSLAMLLRPLRVALAHIMPLDPDNFVHKIALSVLTLLLLSSFIPLVVLSGHPPILEAINNPSFNSIGSGDTGISVRPQDLIYQFMWMIPSTLIGAGWLVARRFPEVLKRLGMVRPTLVQVGVALVLGVAFAFLGNYLDQGIHWLFTTMGWATTDTGAFGELLQGVTNPVGAVLVGVTAGIGEEMAVRGLLQPRFGIIASNLVFTSLHAFQYGLDGLLSVFIVGLVLGIVRAKSNTSTSAIVHGTYDFTIVIATALGF